jgi:hypothetical protein
MPLFGKRREKPSPRVMTAAGRVVDLRDRDTVATLAMTRMAWQAVAWNYRNSIGELGQALRMKGNLLSKLGWTAAYQPPGEDEPVLLTGDPEEDKDEDGKPYVPPHVAQAAIECLQQLPWGKGYGFTGRISTGFDVPGEVWLHGFPDPETREESWEVRSTSEVTPSTGGGLLVTTVPGKPPRELDPDEETLIRLWVPHPEWGELADSPLRTNLDVCEDVVLAGREIRAAAMSRIASNGILFIPEGMALVKPDQEVVRPNENGFAAAFTAAMVAPINQEGHVSAVAPMVIYGDPEDGQAIRHITLDRASADDVIERQKAALDRLADSIDLPREAMRGSIGEANHWSAWLIDGQTFENHLEPGARLIADSITQSYMRRRLTMSVADGGWGLTNEEAGLVRCWFDASTITRNTNRSADADAAMDRGAISYDAYLKAKGFDPADKADEEDIQRLIAVKSAAPQDALGKLMEAVAGIKADPEPKPMIVPGQIVRPGQQALPPGAPTDADPNTPPAAPGRGPAQGTPPVPTGARTAAGAQGVLDSVRIIDGEALADIDRQLIEAIRHAAEAELAAALRKAGNKIKAQAQGKDPELAAALKGMDATLVPSFVTMNGGGERFLELGLTEDVLLAAAFAYLQSKFAVWTQAAIKDAVLAISAMLAFPLVTTQALASAMAERIPTAWKRLESSLRARAMSALYGRKGDALPQGEVPDTIILPGDIREALAEIGGPSHGNGPGGLALGGDILREVDQRAVSLGFTWRYGVTPRARAFHPHRQLAGERFESYTDDRLVPTPEYAWLGPHMHPGDHHGCMCDAVPAWAVGEADSAAAEIVGVETQGMRNERLLAQLDDAAGRVGTHSQRTRDERLRMVEVQQAWIERRAPR